MKAKKLCCSIRPPETLDTELPYQVLLEFNMDSDAERFWIWWGLKGGQTAFLNWANKQKERESQ